MSRLQQILLNAKRHYRREQFTKLTITDEWAYPPVQRHLKQIHIAQFVTAFLDEQLHHSNEDKLDKKGKFPVPLIYALAAQSLRKGRHELAVRMLLTHIDKNTAQFPHIISYNIAKIYALAGNHKKSTFYLQIALKESPFFSEAVYDLCLNQTREGRQAEALQMVERHLKSTKIENMELVHAAYLNLCASTNLRTPKEAMRLLNGQQLSLTSYYNLAVWLRRQGENERAMEMLVEVYSKLHQMMKEDDSRITAKDRNLLVLCRVNLFMILEAFPTQNEELDRALEGLATIVIRQNRPIVKAWDIPTFKKYSTQSETTDQDILSILSTHVASHSKSQYKPSSNYRLNRAAKENMVGGDQDFEVECSNMREYNNKKLQYLLIKQKEINNFFKNLVIRKENGGEKYKFVYKGQERTIDMGENESLVRRAKAALREEEFEMFEKEFQEKRKMQEFRYNNVEVETMMEQIMSNLDSCSEQKKKPRTSARPALVSQAQRRPKVVNHSESGNKMVGQNRPLKNQSSERSLNNFRIKQGMGSKQASRNQQIVNDKPQIVEKSKPTTLNNTRFKPQTRQNQRTIQKPSRHVKQAARDSAPKTEEKSVEKNKTKVLSISKPINIHKKPTQKQEEVKQKETLPNRESDSVSVEKPMTVQQPSRKAILKEKSYKKLDSEDQVFRKVTLKVVEEPPNHQDLFQSFPQKPPVSIKQQESAEPSNFELSRKETLQEPLRRSIDEKIHQSSKSMKNLKKQVAVDPITSIRQIIEGQQQAAPQPSQKKLTSKHIIPSKKFTDKVIENDATIISQAKQIADESVYKVEVLPQPEQTPKMESNESEKEEYFPEMEGVEIKQVDSQKNFERVQPVQPQPFPVQQQVQVAQQAQLQENKSETERQQETEQITVTPPNNFPSVKKVAVQSKTMSPTRNSLLPKPVESSHPQQEQPARNQPRQAQKKKSTVKSKARYDPMASSFQLTGFNKGSLAKFMESKKAKEKSRNSRRASKLPQLPEPEATKKAAAEPELPFQIPKSEFEKELIRAGTSEKAENYEEAYLIYTKMYKTFKQQHQKQEILLKIAQLFEMQEKQLQAEKTYLKCTKFNNVEAFLKLGSLLIKNGRISSGVENLEKANCMKRDNLQIQNKLVYGYSLSEDTMEKALTLAHTILKKEPQSLQTLIMTANILEKQGKVREAIEIVTALDTVKQAEYIKHYLGLLHLSNSNFTQAFNHFKAALALQPDHVPSLIEVATIISDISPKQSISLLNKVLSIEPQNRKALARLGKIYESVENDFDKAMAIYRTAVQSQENYESYMKIADVFAKQDSYLEALVNYKEALNLKKTHEVHASIARMLQKKNELIKAIENYETAIQLLQKEKDFNLQTFKEYTLALGRINVMAFNYDAAIECFEEVMQYEETVDLHKLIAEAYFGKKQHKVALEHYEKANSLAKGERVEILESMAICFDKMEEYLASKAIYERILDIDASNVKCINNLANILLITGETNEAFYMFESMLEKVPKNVEKRMKVADIYAEVGDWSKVEYHLQQCLKVKEHDPRIIERLITLYKEKRNNKMVAKFEKRLTLLRAHKGKH